MLRGAIPIGLIACLAGCAGGGGQLEIRAKDPSAALRNGAGSLDYARGQLALGNVGLALEGFRKAAREHPESPEPLRGIAACYDAMGRHDLARSNYEAALALAPGDSSLLNALAGSLERRGLSSEATAVRAEARQRAPASAPAAVAKAPVAEVRSAAAAAKPVARPDAPKTAQRAEQIAEVRAVPTQLAKALPPAQVMPAPTATVTVTLPPVRDAAPRTAPVPAQPVVRSAPAAVAVAAKPKLERMSPGEVALLTSGKPAWRAVVVAESRQSTTVRFVPLKMASARPAIRLLNAARRQGLAARSRDYLVGLGWRRIDIGDAPQPRDRSVVYYPVKHAVIGRRLAAQFGIASAAAQNSNEFLVLLGRDSARRSRARNPG